MVSVVSCLVSFGFCVFVLSFLGRPWVLPRSCFRALFFLCCVVFPRVSAVSCRVPGLRAGRASLPGGGVGRGSAPRSLLSARSCRRGLSPCGGRGRSRRRWCGASASGVGVSGLVVVRCGLPLSCVRLVFSFSSGPLSGSFSSAVRGSLCCLRVGPCVCVVCLSGGCVPPLFSLCVVCPCFRRGPLRGPGVCLFSVGPFLRPWGQVCVCCSALPGTVRQVLVP